MMVFSVMCDEKGKHKSWHTQKQTFITLKDMSSESAQLKEIVDEVDKAVVNTVKKPTAEGMTQAMNALSALDVRNSSQLIGRDVDIYFILSYRVLTSKSFQMLK